jgi:BolA protein
MNEQEIVERVRQLYPDALVDLDGADCSFEMIVISEAFAGMNTLQRQQPILALFKDELSTGKLHALSIRAKTPAEQSAGLGLVQIKGI